MHLESPRRRRAVARASFAALLAASLALPLPGAAHEPAKSASSGSAHDDTRTRAEVEDAPVHRQHGLASYYGPGFHGRPTASGEIFDKHERVAAHPSFPLGTQARVTNRKNGRSVELRINDRGPTKENQREGVVIDLSEGVARELGMIRDGRAPVTVDVLAWGDDERKPAG